MLRVFIASPSDLNNERHRFREILDEVNRIKGHQMGVHLEVLGWEDTLPGKGRPQSLINKDIEKCDLFVLLVWKRWGTPSGKFSSGIEEEFELAKKLNESNDGTPSILLYFKSVPDEMMADPGEQLKQVIAFRTKIEQTRTFFYSTFDSAEEWSRKYLEHISRWLDDQPPLEHPLPRVDFPPEIESRVRELESKLEQVTDDNVNAQLKMKQAAIAIGLKAISAARDGRFTEAQAYFAESLSTFENPETINAYVLFMEDLGRGDLVDKKFKKRRDQSEQTEIAIAFANLGNININHGDEKKAIHFYSRAIAVLQNPVQFYSLFISYAEKDRNFATRIHNDLQAKGVRCWFAPQDMKIGDKIRNTIYDAIRIYDRLLLVLSTNSVQSDWVEDEVESAFSREKNENELILNPIRIDDSVMKTDRSWAVYLRNTRHIGDFTRWKEIEFYKKSFDRLLRDLNVKIVSSSIRDQ